jgi:hypothetical protein
VLYILDNRRVEAPKRAGVPFRYRAATADEAANGSWRFTTKSGGTHSEMHGK